MRPFKMFFGFSIAIIMFMFVARVAFVAFIAAGIMSIVYAIYRRMKDFVTYDRYGEPYMKRAYNYNHQPKMGYYNAQNRVEPLFNEDIPNHRKTVHQVRF